MRLSYILLVAAAAFVANLDTTAASDVVDSMPAVESTARFLRASKEVKYEEELDDDEDKDDIQEDRMFGWLTGQANAINAMRKVLSTNTDDMAETVMALSKKEVDDMFEHGQSYLSSVISNYRSGMTPEQFGTAVLASKKLNTHEQQMLILGYSRYMQLNNL